jgi:bifunctional UDP-N-acetylglucosamine pyrophosphorylase/glucosamine-1-phosphate N-acetyltransferase
LNIVVLAAGFGKRMASPLPKLLHPLGGRPMLAHVLDTARSLAPERLVVVIGHGGEEIQATFSGLDLHWVEQTSLLGTGHAVMNALPALTDAAVTLVMNGDVPLVLPSTMRRLADAASHDTLALLTVELPDASGYGRVMRDASGEIVAIVEHKDATPAQRLVREINTGIMAIPTRRLKAWLERLDNRNAQGEYYLTDIFAMAREEGVAIVAVKPDSIDETRGINSQAQRVELERIFQRREAHRLLDAGVMLADVERIEQRGQLSCGVQVSIDINCIFEGKVALGNRVRIGAHCVLKDVDVGSDTVIEPYSHIDGASIDHGARIGPFARIRPGSELAAEVHIGNFVEVKNSSLGMASKVNHLSYLGDASIGAAVNIGAGTITCNYDGANKHRTVIEDNVHIGSDVQLVAPVTVKAGATVGAGTTVWKDVEADHLAINPKNQSGIASWSRPKKKS